MKSLSQAPMKHRTKKVLNLTGCNCLMGLSLPGGFRNSQRKSNGARTKVILSTSLVAAIKANGTFQRSPLLAPEPFWVKAATNTFTDDQCWCRNAFHVAALHFEPFVLAGTIVAAFSIRPEAFGDGIFLVPSSNFLSSWYIITTQLNTVQTLCCPYPLQTGG